MKPGRNDPCPCGSGKKYKNCCLAAERQRSEAPQELAWSRVRRAIGGVGQTLGAFVMEREAGSLAQIAGHHGGDSVRALRFDAVELELRALWS